MIPFFSFQECAILLVLSFLLFSPAEIARYSLKIIRFIKRARAEVAEISNNVCGSSNDNLHFEFYDYTKSIDQKCDDEQQKSDSDSVSGV